MTAFFTDFFRAQLTANASLMNPANIRVVLFRSAPSMDSGTAQYTGVRTVADLEAVVGWDEVTGIPGYPFEVSPGTPRVTAVSTRTIGSNVYVMFMNAYMFTGLSLPIAVQALGVQYIGTLAGVVNPLIFVTNTPTGLTQNIYAVDGLAAQPDTTPATPTSPAHFPDSTNRWLFGWSVPTGGAQVAPIEGPLAMFKGAPDYESANTQHVWLYPQHANMVANPSFELPGTGYWSSDAAITRVAGGAPGVGAWHGNFAGRIAESNVFPTLQGDLDHEDWTIQLMAKGTGPCKVGLVYWDRDYRGTGSDWGEADWGSEIWDLNPTTWTHLACLRRGYQAHRAMVRIETRSASFKIDQVLAERGYVKDWPYFDGDEKYGAPDSYFWYGGSNQQGKSYSMWYDNRRAVMGRMFATDTNPVNPDDIITDDDVAKWGLVYQWVPAGVQVVPHIDVFYPGDLRAPVPPKTAGVIPYSTGPTDTTGVLNPWPTVTIQATIATTFTFTAMATAVAANPHLVLSEPFNNFTTNGWVLAGGPTPTIIAGGRNGNGAYVQNAAISSSPQATYTIPAPSESADIVVGFAYKIDHVTSSPEVIRFMSDSASTNHCGLQMNSDGSIHFMAGVNLGGSAAGAIALNTWYYIECRVHLADAPNGSWEIRINGVSVASQSSADTKQGGTKTVFDSIRLLTTLFATHNATYDDLYISTGTTTFLGDHAIP